MTRLIIHFGMHKTGSTSIQEALAHLQDAPFTYLDWTQANHSLLFVILFESAPHKYFASRNRGWSEKDVSEIRKRQLAALDQQAAASQHQTAVFSAERIFTAPRIAVERMAAYFKERYSDIQLYGYLRPPVGYCQSMIQQSVRTGATDFEPELPGYKDRLELFDRLFGTANVHTRPFRRDDLLDQDVVGDFTRWAGLGSYAIPAKERNVSLGATSLAFTLLYNQITKLELGRTVRTRSDRAVLSRLMNMASPPFYVDRNLLRRLLDGHLTELDWVSQRLGTPFHLESDLDLPGNAVCFSSLNDVLEHAESHAHLLLSLQEYPENCTSAHDRLRALARKAS
jgi:hypothetical protein